MKQLVTQLRFQQIAHMRNKAMQSKLMTDKALDVRAIGREIEPGVFELTVFREWVDYCDAQTEQWIRSIGRRTSDGAILAATDERFYVDGRYQCVWLR